MNENLTSQEKDNQPQTKKERIALPKYTLGEELISSISHGLGAILGLVGLVLMLIKSDTPVQYIASTIYGLSMMILYSVSSIYHGLKRNKGKRVMRVLDHCMIYLLIIGTYTPFCLVALSDQHGLLFLLGEILIGVVGVTFTAIDVKKYAVLSMICYLTMGWIVIFATTLLVNAIGKTGMLYLLWGGIAYTVGAVFYGFGRKLKYIHSVWHVFVLAGSILHFFSIFYYVL